MTRPLAVLLLACAVAGAESRLSSESEFDFTPSYVFRGLRRGPVGIVSDSQTDFRLTRNLSARWSSFSYLQLENGQGVGESRYGLSAVWSPGPFAIEAGNVYYNRNNKVGNPLFQGPSTHELFAAVTADCAWAPYLAGYYDFDSNVGTYLELGAGRTFGPVTGWQATLSGEVGFDVGRTDGFTHAHVRTELRYPLDKNLRIGPTVDFWVPANDVDPGVDGIWSVVSFGVEYRRGW